MKRLIPLLITGALAFASCRVQTPLIPSITYTESVDYSKYSNFFLTESNSVSFEYKPIASINTVHVQGVDSKTYSIWTGVEVGNKSERKRIVDDVYSSHDNKAEKKKGKAVKITLEGALEEAINEAKKLGANGMINLKITPINWYESSVSNSLEGYKVTGMAIKR